MTTSSLPSIPSILSTYASTTSTYKVPGYRYSSTDTCTAVPHQFADSKAFIAATKLNRNWIPKSEDFVPVSVHCVVCACEPREDVGCIGIAEVDDLNTDYAR